MNTIEEIDDELFTELQSIVTTKKPLIFKLYYDENGKPLYYTCEDLEGPYIVIDAQIYAEGRYDIRVIDGKIINTSEFIYTQKLIPSSTGYNCAKENVNIVVSEEYTGDTITWDVKNYEHKNN